MKNVNEGLRDRKDGSGQSSLFMPERSSCKEKTVYGKEALFKALMAIFPE